MDILNSVKDKLTYAHVVSAMEHPHNVVVSPFPDAVIIHCIVSNVYVVEYDGIKVDDLCAFLKTLSVVRLQTTNRKIYEKLISDFKHNYSCVQVVFSPENITKETDINDIVTDKLELLHPENLSYVQKTYEMPEYISQLYERNRLFGWYENNQLIGYVAFHIDETVGALFVKPEFRKQGYGAKIMKAAFCKYKDGIRYSQILSDNHSSIALHKKIGCQLEEKPVYWVYNEEYLYS